MEKEKDVELDKEMLDKLVPIEVRILYILKKKSMVRYKDIIAFMSVSPSSIYHHLKILMLYGYVTKQGLYYIITPKGLEYLNKVKKFYIDFANSL